jgi:hypothetical protein
MPCDFFFVSDPQPEEPDAIEVSSFELTATAVVCLTVGTALFADDVETRPAGFGTGADIVA